MASIASPRSGGARLSWAWLGVVPFLAFALLFLVLPTMQIVVGAFRNPAGEFTLVNVANLFTPSILGAFWISIRISFASAFLGCVIGFAVAAAVVLGGLPRFLRGPVMTFSGVASNFAGVPLAFAFLATLGRLGLVTVLLREWFGINIYGNTPGSHGFVSGYHAALQEPAYQPRQPAAVTRLRARVTRSNRLSGLGRVADVTR
jgi:putative spermidine/putrescine transport system permease protein